MKRLLFNRKTVWTLFSVLTSLSAWCQSEGVYFTSPTTEGVKVSYHILNVESDFHFVYVEGDGAGNIPPAAISTSVEGSLTIPEVVIYNGYNYGVTDIGYNAFSHCWQLTSISLPDAVTAVSDYAFYCCYNLKSIRFPKKTSYKFFSLSGDETFFLGEASFTECNSLTEIALPEGLKRIGRYAFDGCTSLQTIFLPSSLNRIENGVFKGCSAVTSLSVKAAVPPTVADEEALSACYQATLYVPKGSRSVYQAADYWKNFNKIEENATLTMIAFADDNVKSLCVSNWDTDGDGELSMSEAAAVTDLGEVFKVVPNVNDTPYDIKSFDELKYFTGLTSIGEDAFEGCQNLQSIVLPNSITNIGQNAFLGCGSLASLFIPNSVTKIGAFAFRGCCSLTSITIPASVSSIGSSPFGGCTELASIIVNSENSAYNSHENCNAIMQTNNNTLVAGCKNTIIPNGVITIGYGAFEQCYGLESAIIPSSVTTIKDNAFAYCNKMKTLVIPESVTSIGSQAFYDCYRLESIKSYIREPFSIDKNTFRCWNSTTNQYEFPSVILQVPNGCKEKYQAVNYWNLFANIVEQSKCATPIINYKDGKLHFECETEGVTYHYSITTPESEDNTGNGIAVASTYIIKAYASKEDYVDSDVATKEIDIRGLKGDVDGDGVVDVNDVQTTINIILKK